MRSSVPRPRRRSDSFAAVRRDSDRTAIQRALIARGQAGGHRGQGSNGRGDAGRDSSGADVVRFIRRCIEADVRFKATAGLHHPLRAEFPLTYDAGAPVGAMFGYLNVFLAAGIHERRE